MSLSSVIDFAPRVELHRTKGTLLSASIMDLMKPEVVKIENGTSELRFATRPEFTIPMGVVQGGIVAVMLDMAMAMAAEGGLTTASLQYEILRPVHEGTLTVKGRIVREGRRIVFAQAEMKNQEGVVVAKGTQTGVPIRRQEVSD